MGRAQGAFQGRCLREGSRGESTVTRPCRGPCGGTARIESLASGRQNLGSGRENGLAICPELPRTAGTRPISNPETSGPEDQGRPPFLAVLTGLQKPRSSAGR
uniref:Uncharacterized protein n=1 Tax=Chlorocebus sabaeus TaxID=60711 RepID=A0A0D9RNT5_CHLSB